jgi:hypothetical protein
MRGNKMNATINIMELVKADNLIVYSLEVGDLIKHDSDIVEIIDIAADSTGDNYYLTLVNDFGEEELASYAFDSYVDLYVMVE